MTNKKLTFTITWLLVLQFALGMLANLYASIPQSKPFEVFHQFGFILFHALNATLLVVLGIILAIKTRGQPEFRRAIAGLIHLVLAYASGELFVFTRNDIFSLLMALAFIGSFMIYVRLDYSQPSE